MNKNSSVFRGALLVAGTTIGGGMLALPILTSLGGFFPSLVLYILCWLFMACTGLLFLEVSLWMNGETNIISMAGRTLGKPGIVAAWVLYLFLFYCLTLAYIVGCGSLITEFFNGALPAWAGPGLFILLFSPFVYAGTKAIDKINVFMMVGLTFSFFAFVILGFTFIDPKLYLYRNWTLSLLALPVSFTSFAYQGIVPTLVTYLNHDPKKVRTAILLGSLIPLLVYIIWQGLILGIVPTYGPGGLAEALQNGQNAVQPLRNFIHNPIIYAFGQYFAFFALVTSFFGVTLGLVDFLADGLRIRKTALGKFFLCLIVFIPPLIFASFHPHIFLIALDYAGGYGCAILLGLMPVLMVWRGRYYLGLKSEQILPGGRLVLSILLLLFVVIGLIVEFIF